MRRSKAIIAVNANYHRVAGNSLLEDKGPRFQEYRAKWDEWPQAFHVGEFPLFIDIEVTSLCNLSCPFCATTYRGQRITKGFAAPDTVKKIIDEGAEKGLYGVKFNIRGEPLLHPRIHEFVRYAKEKGLIDVYFNSNALLLTEETSRKLIDAGLDRISISFEGYTREVYERYRVGSNYDVVLSNIEKLQSLRQRLGTVHPKIRVQTVLRPELIPMLEEYGRFWGARADEVGFLDYKEMKKKKVGNACPWVCPQIWQRMAVWWDGTILPCNHDDDGWMALGNVDAVSIEKAWHSEELARVRDMHKRGLAHKLQACDGCYLRDSEISKLREKDL